MSESSDSDRIILDWTGSSSDSDDDAPRNYRIIMETKNKKSMTKEEVELLVYLIHSTPVITSKVTNSFTNKSKEEAWSSLTDTFNASTGSIPRSKDQLKFKWDNLKKAARKRSQLIRMNSLKTGGGKPDFIPPDEILEKVAAVLGSTCVGFKVPFGGDGVGLSSSSQHSEEDVLQNVRPNLPNCTIKEDTSFFTSNDSAEVAGTNFDMTSNHSADVIGNTPIHYSGVLGDSGKIMSSKPSKLKKKNYKANKRSQYFARLARNMAIANYYDKKSVKVELKIRLLEIELAKKKREVE